MKPEPLKFIDLFAGLGGFHKALSELGHKCVFASEIDPTLQKLYKENWKIEAHGDIRKHLDEIPNHDILCAGFPCQPFSKAGKQLGMQDQVRGTLFDEIVKILESKTPSYFILENVPLIKKHDNEETWKYMEKEFDRLKYDVDYAIYSPHEFGIPQHRKRIYIVGAKHGLEHFSFDIIDKQKTTKVDIKRFIEENPNEYRKLPKANRDCIKLWQQFIDAIPKETKLPGFPIWGMEFGADYPFETSYPTKLSVKELGNYRGNFGKSLKGMTKEQQILNLPSYARIKKSFPNWKKSYIRQNRQFYIDNLKYLKDIVNQISQYESQSWQKLEWNVGNNKRLINNYILQFRASGIRIKESNVFPSLVCTNTQIPIIGWKNRYITRNEGLSLQSLNGVKLPDNDNAAFKALGNAVNSQIVKLIVKALLDKSNILYQKSIQQDLFAKSRFNKAS